MTMKPKGTFDQMLDSMSRETVLQCLGYVQARRARDEVLQGLLQARLARLTSTNTDSARDHQDELLTVPEVAERLKLKSPYVYDLIRQGRLTAVRIGKYVRVSRTAVAAWHSHSQRHIDSPSTGPGCLPAATVGRREYLHSH